MDAAAVADAKVGVDGDVALGIPGKRGTAEYVDAGVNSFAGVLIDRHLPLPVTGFAALFAGELEHAGVPGDDHAELVDGGGLGDPFDQFRLLIGVHLEDVLDAQPFQYLAHGNLELAPLLDRARLEETLERGARDGLVPLAPIGRLIALEFAFRAAAGR